MVEALDLVRPSDSTPGEASCEYSLGTVSDMALLERVLLCGEKARYLSKSTIVGWSSSLPRLESKCCHTRRTDNCLEFSEREKKVFLFWETFSDRVLFAFRLYATYCSFISKNPCV